MEANNAYLEGKKLKLGNKMNFYTHEAQQILLDDSLFDLPYFTGCQAGNGVCCIKANGDILPCVLLDIPIGNIRENSFSTIWLNSPILEERYIIDRNILNHVYSVFMWRNAVDVEV